MKSWGDSVPEKRNYVSPLREQAAARTRELILVEATQLFAERGYGRVTVADIAAAAGVSSKTIFASVGSKADILDKIVDEGVAASGYEQAMRDIVALDAPKAVLAALARGTRAGNEGQFTIHEAIRKALPAHDAAEQLWDRAMNAYREALNATARHLHTLTEKPQTPEEETAGLLWLWFGPNSWRTLVVDNGWTWDRAEQTLARIAHAAL